MKTMVEYPHDGTRILWDYPPEALRDRMWPGAKLVPTRAVVPRSICTDARDVQSYRLERDNRYLGATLTEIP